MKRRTNLMALNALPARRFWMPPRPDFSEQVTLDPLNRSMIGNQDFLVAKIDPATTVPFRANGSFYTIEAHQKIGWDRAIPEDAIVVHEVRTNGLSYLQPGIW
jgi:hypothetical protein